MCGKDASIYIYMYNHFLSYNTHRKESFTYLLTNGLIWERFTDFLQLRRKQANDNRTGPTDDRPMNE